MNRKFLFLLVCWTMTSSLAWMLISSSIMSMYAYAGGSNTSNVDIANPPLSSIIIFISGSTNSCPSTLYISSKSTVTSSSCHSFMQRQKISPILIANFIKDVIGALPLNKLPQNHGCFKSVSFGTTTTVAYSATKSPDISCSVDTIGEKIYQDVLAIQNALQHL